METSSLGTFDPETKRLNLQPRTYGLESLGFREFWVGCPKSRNTILGICMVPLQGLI